MQQNLGNKKNGNAFVVKWAKHTQQKNSTRTDVTFLKWKKNRSTPPVHSNNSPEKHWTQIECKVDFTNHDQGFLLFVCFSREKFWKQFLCVAAICFFLLSAGFRFTFYFESSFDSFIRLSFWVCVCALVLRFLQPIHFTVRTWSILVNVRVLRLKMLWV